MLRLIFSAQLVQVAQEMTPQMLAALVSLVISIALDHSPKLKEWWDNLLSPDGRFLIILGMFILLPLGMVGLACLGIVTGVALYCPAPGEAGQAIFNTILLGLAAFSLGQYARSSLPHREDIN